MNSMLDKSLSKQEKTKEATELQYHSSFHHGFLHVDAKLWRLETQLTFHVTFAEMKDKETHLLKPFELMMMIMEFLIMNYKDGQEVQISTTVTQLVTLIWLKNSVNFAMQL